MHTVFQPSISSVTQAQGPDSQPGTYRTAPSQKKSLDVSISSFSSEPSSSNNAFFSPDSSKLGHDIGIASPLSAHPSVVAVHGSVVTPLHANLKDSRAYLFPAPSTRLAREDWDNKAAREIRAARIDEVGSPDDAPVVPNGRVIGIDFDDVICEWIPVLVKEFNAVFGADLTLDDMASYYMWQNKGWGTIPDAKRKMHKLRQTMPMGAATPGVVTALKHLHSLGHPLHIVTSRPEDDRSMVMEWLNTHGLTVGTGDNDIIAAAWFCDAYGNSKGQHTWADEDKRSTASGVAREKALEEWLKDKMKAGSQGGQVSTKLKALRSINAALFIDDHHGNITPIIQADPPLPCILFGAYPWNQSTSGMASPLEQMTYGERLEAGLDLPALDIELNENLIRAKGWDEIIEWVQDWDRKDEDGKA